MAYTVDTKLEINAPIEKVWKTLTDFGSWEEWNNQFRFDSKFTPKEGETAPLKISRDGGKNWLGLGTPTFVEVRENEILSWGGQVAAGYLVAAKHYFKLEKISEERTLLIHVEEFQGLVKYFLPIPKLQEQYNQLNQKLQAFLEKSKL